MFAEAVNALMDGRVICHVTEPELFDHLSDADKRERINTYVRQIGWRVVATHNKSGYFLVPDKPGEATGANLSSMHRKIMGDVRPMIDFLALCLAVGQTDSVLRPGDRIYPGQYASRIEASSKLFSDLKTLYPKLSRSTGKKDAADMLKAVLKNLEHRGYMKETDYEGDRSYYEATGMVDAFHDLVDFLIANTPEAQESVDEFIQQESLL
ncbi:condensin complex protein MksE [Ruegeria sp.]|uniref:condensin complex protein MksE n=1 Tax=Ruegeria sp. TaxID=1879320 RepID=UPI003B00A37A